MKTNKPFIILAFLFCGMMPVIAQSGKFFAGLKAGLGIPNLTSGGISTPLSEGYASRMGFYGGLVSELRSGTHFGLRMEINYSSQGGQRSGMQALPLYPQLEPLWAALTEYQVPHDDYMYADIKSEAILDYLEIPVMGKYRFHLGSKINFYLQAGPYMGILLHAKDVTSGNSSLYVDKARILPVDVILQAAQQTPIGEVPFDNTQNITSDVKRFNVGFQGAAGFGLIMKSGEFFLEGGGNYGFIPVQKDDANGNNNTGAGTVTVGYLFNL